MKRLLSIIIPAYNEEDNITHTAETVLDVMENAAIPCEIIFVSDGSKDITFDKILQASYKDSKIKGIEFSRNFGKEAAIFAGLDKASGNCLAVIDCDLQHPPETLVEMYRLWEQGYEIIEGIKSSRGKESKIHKKFANMFYGLISVLTGFDMKNTSDFKLIDRKVADILIKMPERKTFFRALTFWVGFKSCHVYYDVAPRSIGTSKWSTKNLFRYAISNIISFSSGLLNIVAYLGVLTIIFGFAVSLQTLIRWIGGNAVEGFTTVILLVLFLCGSILIGLGIIGRYIAAIYEEIKQRPRYIVCRDSDDYTCGEQKNE